MSFLKKLFGMGSAGSKKPKVTESAEHKGFNIDVTPMPEGGQYRIHGTISKEINGELKEHTLIRADVVPSTEVAGEITIRKAKQMIDQLGDRVFG